MASVGGGSGARVVRMTTFLPWVMLIVLAVVVWAVYTIVDQAFQVPVIVAVASAVLAGLLTLLLLVRSTSGGRARKSP